MKNFSHWCRHFSSQKHSFAPSIPKRKATIVLDPKCKWVGLERHDQTQRSILQPKLIKCKLMLHAAVEKLSWLVSKYRNQTTRCLHQNIQFSLVKLEIPCHTLQTLHVAMYIFIEQEYGCRNMVKALIQWHARRTNIPKIIFQFPYWFILTANKLTWPINYACREFRFGFSDSDFIQFRLTLVTAEIVSNATQTVILYFWC